MTVSDIRTKYLDFFRARGHVVVPSAPLVPENDPTTLFTGSGMQPMLPYLLGTPHPEGVRIADAQKCLRAQDIEDIGDNRHTTFFEMLGNWSLGDYYKKEQIGWMFEFLTEVLGIDPRKLYVTCFIGAPEYDIPKDTEAGEIWQALFKQKGIEARTADIGTEQNGYRRGMQEGERIFYYDGTKNWWNRGATSPETTPVGDPCGPDSEMFFDFGTPHDSACGEHCHPNCDCGRFIEIGNNVFMAYRKVAEGVFTRLAQPNIDHGSGLERIVAAVKGVPDIFMIDTMKVLIDDIAHASGKAYTAPEYQPSFRIVADHVRGVTFMMADGVTPSHTDQGYIARRLIRRAVRHLDVLGVGEGTLVLLARRVIASYASHYPELSARRDAIEDALREEERKFRKTLKEGIKEFEKIAQKGTVTGSEAFILFSTFGFPLELSLELAEEQGVQVDREGFQKEYAAHRRLSKRGAAQKFKGGLSDTGAHTTMLHTATHLMLAGLREHLGPHVHQAGSNITPERTRFDITHPERIDEEVLRNVERYVNDAIAARAEMTVETMPKETAQAQGVEGSFWERYPDTVQVYTLKDANGTVWSRELCGGPHVKNTRDITGTFRIVKEQSSSAGVRRIKATLSQ